MENTSKVVSLTRRMTEQNANVRAALTALSNITHSPVVGVTLKNNNKTVSYGITPEKLEKVREAVRVLYELTIGDYDMNVIVEALLTKPEKPTEE